MINKSKKVAFHTLGCKVNAAESDVLASSFLERGYSVVDFNEESDVYLINTCTVTHQADSQCRQIIRKAKRRSPDATIAVIGCYAQSDPLAVSSIPGVDLVLGTREKFKIFDHLQNNSCFSKPLIYNDLNIDPFDLEKKLPYGTSRTRAYLKIQDGCSYKCTYCIIPTVRGQSISRKKEDVLARLNEIIDLGYKEVVVTAVNLGEYENGKEYGLLELLKDIVTIKDVPRIRLTSIEPNCFSEDLIKFVGDNEMICPHFHVPLQSGSNSILGSMKRKYRTDHYEKVMEYILKYVPNAGIGADVMVGFPGESDEDFSNTFKFLCEMPVTYLHIFRYSPRTGTSAAEMNNFIHPDIAKERSKKLLELSASKKENFLEDQIGKTSDVLFETRAVDASMFEGFSENYSRIRCSGEELSNKIMNIKVIERHDALLTGVLTSEN